MIVMTEDLLQMPEFADADLVFLKKRAEAVEQLVRAYTNNNFQNRFVRFQTKSEKGILIGTLPYLKKNDTVQISQSHVNDGLYLISEIVDGRMVLDRELYDVPVNLVTKVEYPADITAGVTNLLIWEQKNRDKVGVKSETLSRHSVTYYDQDTNNTIMGYPVSLMGFLKPYMKARF